MGSEVSFQDKQDAKTIYEYVKDRWSDANTDTDERGMNQRDARTRLYQLSEGINGTGSSVHRHKALWELQGSNPGSAVIMAVDRIIFRV